MTIKKTAKELGLGRETKATRLMCGDIVELAQDQFEQYVIEDWEAGVLTLRKLEKDETVKGESVSRRLYS